MRRSGGEQLIDAYEDEDARTLTLSDGAVLSGFTSSMEWAFLSGPWK